MTDTRHQMYSYESPRIEARTPIDGPLVGGEISSNSDTFDSASFTRI